MKIEFTYSEVIDFIRIYSLFKKTVMDRAQFLSEHGVIDDNFLSVSIKQKYNQLIYDDILLSNLIRNSFWEQVIKDITGNSISIIDHKDDTIKGVCCDACGYIVFDDKDDAFYEICPVCGWQNDSKLGDEYSGCNHCTMNEFKRMEDFNKKLAIGKIKYIKP